MANWKLAVLTERQQRVEIYIFDMIKYNQILKLKQAKAQSQKRLCQGFSCNFSVYCLQPYSKPGMSLTLCL